MSEEITHGERNVIYQETCLRCLHTWWPQTTRRPERCPKCRAKFWWMPRKWARPDLRKDGSLMTEMEVKP